MRRHFEEVEEDLRKRLLSMGSLVEEMIHSAVQGLVQWDGDFFQTVMENEEKVKIGRAHV